MDENETQKEQVAGLYDRTAARYGRVGPDFFSYGGRQLVERIGLAAGARVLDVGAGRGANLFPAAEAVGPGGQVIGIDLAQGMVAETTAEITRHHLAHASMQQMDTEQMTFADASFDAVLCGFAIFLFPHLEQVLAEWFRVLRPGGKVGVTVAQHLDALNQWYGKHLTAYHERYHFPLSVGSGKDGDYEELPQYLAQAGFRHAQVQVEEVDFAFASAQEWWDSKWTHGTRYHLEHMAPEVLAQFKDEVFARLEQEAQAGGIHETLRFQYVLAEKPKPL